MPGDALAIPKPFGREIFLFDTHIAGTTFIDGIEELEPHLNIDHMPDFFRDPNNAHDSKAIVIKNVGCVKIAYVPQDDNLVAVRLMDAGKLLYTRISAREMRGKWLKMDIWVYFHE